MKKYFFIIFFIFTSFLYLLFPDQILAITVPMLGTTHTHYVFPNGSMDNGAIIQTYANPGVRDQVRTQLSQMKNAGVQTLDLVVWHMHEDPQPWGVIPSVGGRISDPYRTNLINYLTDIKQTGFNRLLITFGPMWNNSPSNCDGWGVYVPALFDENWKFIQDIRSIAKQYGPQNIIFDLLGEGAPNDYWPCHQQMYDYDVKLWQLYVNTYGKSDAMISFIAVPSNEVDNKAHIIENLVSIYKTAGVGFPDWFYFSFYVNDNPDQNTAYNSLVHIDQVLSDNGLNQVLRTRETYYNNQNVGNAIKQFNQSHARQVDEVIQWYITPNDRDQSINPPYNVDVYKSIFGGISSGSISAIPNPCILTGSQSTCASTITWSTYDAKDVCILVDNNGPFTCGPSGSSNAPWISAAGNTFVLYANYNTSLTPQQNLSTGNLKELARLTLTAVISLPNPTNAPLLSITPVVTGNYTCIRKINGDADCDGKINLIDYSLWLNSQCNIAGQCANLKADFNNDSKVNDTDYLIWFDNRG